MGQSVGGPGGLLGFMAQRRRDAIANQLLQENGYPGTGGEVELSLRNRMEQMRAQAAQRQMMADYRAAETARIQHAQSDEAAREKWANDQMATTPGMEQFAGGGTYGLQFATKMKQWQDVQDAKKQALQGQADALRRKQAMQMAGPSIQDKRQADETAKKIEALNREIEALRGPLDSTGLPIDDLLKADAVAAPAGALAPGAAPQLTVSAGGKQDVVNLPLSQDNMGNAKFVQSAPDFVQRLSALKSANGRLQNAQRMQDGFDAADRIARMAASGDPEAGAAHDWLQRKGGAAAWISRGGDPVKLYQKMLQRKQQAGSPVAPAGLPGPGGGGSPDGGGDPEGAEGAAPPGYSPAASAAGFDPEEGLSPSPDDDETAAP